MDELATIRPQLRLRFGWQSRLLWQPQVPRASDATRHVSIPDRRFEGSELEGHLSDSETTRPENNPSVKTACNFPRLSIMGRSQTLRDVN